MRINPKTKGASGEREFCEYLFKTFNLEIKPERNLNQVRSGGCDVICFPFAFEVKRREQLQFADWWNQVNDAVTKDPQSEAFGLIPVVAFRQNKKDWEFLIGGNHINVPFGFLHINKYVFNRWVRNKLEQVEALRNNFKFTDDLTITMQRHLLGAMK